MNRQYSFLADVLEKFHNSSEIVQITALIIPALLFLILGIITKILIAPIKEAVIKPKELAGKLVYTVYLGDENQLLIFKHQKSAEIMMLKPDLEKLQKE